MLIPSSLITLSDMSASLSRRVNANSQPIHSGGVEEIKLIKKGEC